MVMPAWLPTDAIRFEEREAPAYDETAVKAMQSRKKAEVREMQARETQAENDACGQRGPVPAESVALSASAGICPASFLKGPIFDRGRLHCLRLCRIP